MTVHVLPPRPAPAVTTQGYSSPWGKAGPIGPGAGVLLTEYLAPWALGGGNDQARMRKAWQLGQSIGYVFAAERVISGRVSGMGPIRASQAGTPGLAGWHLEDPDGETVDDTYGVPAVREAWELLANPMGALTLAEAGGQRQTRRQQWGVTSRHMGLCGQGAWVLDGLNDWGMPRAILYCRPDRLTADLGQDGALIGWLLDKGSVGNMGGTPLALSEVKLLYLQAPDEGYFATGLVQAAVVKATLNGTIDRHFQGMLAAGGRLSGILSPRDGVIEDETTYQGMVRDWRNVVEQPEAARRLQVVRAPVDFTRTVSTPAEMGLTEVMSKNREDLLAIWGVPYSQLGGSPAAGMGMGEARDSDRQALWENAVQLRLDELAEGIQDLLDRLKPQLGWAPLFVWDMPDLEPDATKYDKVSKSSTLAMRNVERRALIGLAPFGDDVLGTTGGKLDDEVWVPMTIGPLQGTDAGVAPPTSTEEVAAPESPETPADVVQEEETAEAETEGPNTSAVGSGKARLGGTARVRAAVDRRVVPPLRRALSGFLSDQAAAVAKLVRDNWDTITAKPNDTSAWWGRASTWDAKLSKVLQPSLATTAGVVADHVASLLGDKPAKAGPAGRPDPSYGPAARGAVEYALSAGSHRITRINQDTMRGVQQLVAQALREGMSAREAGQLIEDWRGWDEYRAERIARTETMFAYNTSTLATYDDYGVQQVEAIDGDDDEECAQRNGQVYDLATAMSIEDHPNGTLDWVPVVPA